MKKLFSFMASALVVASTSAFAQETNSDEGLSLGTPAAPKVTQEVIGDWTLNCRSNGEREICEMFQLLTQTDGAPAVAVTLFPVVGQGQAVAGANMIAPLETLLTAQLSIAVDENLPRVYPFAFCNANGCLSRVGLTQEDLASYKAGGVATISIVPAAQPDRLVQVQMSLKGFTKAFDTAAAKLQ
ncbi:invasion associated locus B family protein [Cognatishimia sp.]|uniref:invasion associated locus B family protein n=1 Tax=Cognatishimia sp. TaxID=2211648 RepID=UPI003517B377